MARSKARGCLVSLGGTVVGVGLIVVAVVATALWALHRIDTEQRFLADEHSAWPKPTPLGALTTRSPDGRFTTTSHPHGGDGRSSHSETHDCVFVVPARCPATQVEITAQDRAQCETNVLACRSRDGELAHERYALSLRWIDPSHLETSWTEMTGTDASGHRDWGRMKEVSTVTLVKSVDGGTDSELADCGGYALDVEAGDPTPAK